MLGSRRASVPLGNEPFGIAVERKMKRPPKVDGGTMHGRDMTQQFPTDRMAFSAPLVHNLLEMMCSPRHGYIG